MAKAFGFESTTEDVLDGVNLAGKRAFVTGVSAGLGVETTRALTSHGAEVTGAARDLVKARKALEAAGVDLKRVDLVELDLASLASVRACADALHAAPARSSTLSSTMLASWRAPSAKPWTASRCNSAPTISAISC